MPGCPNFGAAAREAPVSAYDAPPKIHKRNYWLAKEIYSRIANKMPMRRVLESVGIHPPLYYSMTNFIRRRCCQLAGKVERALAEGRLRLPETLRLATDAQEYTLNWMNRLDRRNTVFSAVCTTDADSRCVFGLHANYDPEPHALEMSGLQSADRVFEESGGTIHFRRNGETRMRAGTCL